MIIVKLYFYDENLFTECGKLIYGSEICKSRQIFLARLSLISRCLGTVDICGLNDSRRRRDWRLHGVTYNRVPPDA